MVGISMRDTERNILNIIAQVLNNAKKKFFPMFCGFVPDDKRKLAISKVIQKELYNFWELFTVITLDECSDYIKGGVSNESEESR